MFFATDKYTLEQGAELAVLDFAKTVKQDTSARSILIVGHTDSTGTDEYNITLSENRAATVAAALLRYGIAERYLEIVPMGRAQPLTTNSTLEGRAMNRRVEFFISDIPAATKAAIEQVKFNPCDSAKPETTSGSDCSSSPKEAPVLPASGEGQPLAEVDLTRSAIPSNPEPVRPALPVDRDLERPALGEPTQE